ncbi:MAG: DNA translocase FtsK [Alloprevotella sp.]|nr:DNA translocase FtsK [Alloprevotella sp.]
MDMTPVFLIAFLVCCVFMIAYKLSHSDEGKEDSKVMQKRIEQAEAQFSPEQLKFLKTAGSLFNQNMILPLSQIYVKCGMPHDIACSHNPDLINTHIPFEKGSDGCNVFRAYAWAVDRRYRLKYDPLLEHPNEVLNLNLHGKEKIYHVIHRVVLYQEKKTVTNIAYSGVRWTSGPLRTGTLNVIANESTHFSPMDIGHLVFTNQRLIYIGRQKNVTKQIKLLDILYSNLYQDGVMVHVPNRKPLLFKFPDNKDFEIGEVSDGINEFTIVFDRLVKGDYLEDQRPATADNHAVQESKIKELLTARNYEPLIADALPLMKVGEETRTSMLQRELSIGYARAGKMMDEMESLKLVSPLNNNKRQWLIDGHDYEAVKNLVELAKTKPARG